MADKRQPNDAPTEDETDPQPEPPKRRAVGAIGTFATGTAPLGGSPR